MDTPKTYKDCATTNAASIAPKCLTATLPLQSSGPVGVGGECDDYERMVRFCKTSASPWTSYNAGLEPGRAGVWVVSPPFTSVQQNHQIWKGATGTFPVWWCGSGSGHLVSRMQRAACGGGRGGGNWTDSICISSMEPPGRYGYVTSYLEIGTYVYIVHSM